MNLNAVLVKTPKGQEEVDTRKYKLDMRARALLIMVNGKSTAAEIQQKFGQMGDVSAKLEQLVSGGFVAEAAGATTAGQKSGGFESARAQIAKAMTDALGPSGEAITEKLEVCESAQELRDFLDTRRAMLDSVLGRKRDAFWSRVKELLG